jgi:hypothetical protein
LPPGCKHCGQPLWPGHGIRSESWTRWQLQLVRCFQGKSAGHRPAVGGVQVLDSPIYGSLSSRTSPSAVVYWWGQCDRDYYELYELFLSLDFNFGVWTILNNLETPRNPSRLFVWDPPVQVWITLDTSVKNLYVFPQVSGEGIARAPADALHGFQENYIEEV